MATLKAHGKIVGQIDYTTYSKAYMSDGNILRNNGDGWKIYRKVKEGFTPVSAYKHAVEVMEKYDAIYPASAQYRRELYEVAGLSKRWLLHTAVSLNPDDPDGVWSDACDGFGDNVSASIDEIVELCRLYKLSKEEMKEVKEKNIAGNAPQSAPKADENVSEN